LGARLLSGTLLARLLHAHGAVASIAFLLYQLVSLVYLYLSLCHSALPTLQQLPTLPTGCRRLPSAPARQANLSPHRVLAACSQHVIVIRPSPKGKLQELLGIRGSCWQCSMARATEARTQQGVAGSSQAPTHGQGPLLSDRAQVASTEGNICCA